MVSIKENIASGQSYPLKNRFKLGAFTVNSVMNMITVYCAENGINVTISLLFT